MKKILAPLLCAIVFICALIGLVKVNIINTQILSPLGNTDSNFDIVSKEFGEDFTEFIKDKSPIKIYIGEKGDKEAKVKVLNKEINLTLNNTFIIAVEPVFNYINDKIDYSIEKINKNEEKENNKTENKNEEKEEINKIVDEFIEWKEGLENN